MRARCRRDPITPDRQTLSNIYLLITHPVPLPPGFLPAMSDLYRALSETWTGERLWNAPDLHAATQAVATLIQ